jgi:hypothetical protein
VSTAVYPVHVDATLDTGHLSRALWLVKWLLAIPHYIVLAFLWVAFFFLSVVAFFAILFTGRYPHAIFDFNVGVLRWSWRVAYYTYGALGTDRYPPFTLYERADYPAHLTVDYPEHLSRGLVLVKWWLLAIPHYLVVAFLAGSGLYVAWGTAQGNGDGGTLTWGGGLIGLLVIIAAVVLLFTGRYPQQIFDLVLGLNRWVLRVAAYATLMTDEYPPFRLDMGGHEPDGSTVTVPMTSGPTASGATPSGPTPSGPTATAAPGAPAAPGTAPGAPAAPGTTPSSGGGGIHWGAGRVITVVLAALLFLVAGGFLLGGTTLAVADQTLRDDQGFLMSPTETLSTTTYAIASEPFTIDSAATGDYVPESLVGDVTVRADAGAGDVFIGVAQTSDAADYLAGVEHATLVDFTDTDGGVNPVFRETPGSAPTLLPADSDVWVATATGTGEQELRWAPETGDWTVVVMNTDGAANVTADMSVGAEVPVLGAVIVGLLVTGGVLLVLSIVLVILALTVGRGTPTQGTPAQAGPPPGGTTPMQGTPQAGPTPGATTPESGGPSPGAPTQAAPVQGPTQGAPVQGAPVPGGPPPGAPTPGAPTPGAPPQDAQA